MSAAELPFKNGDLVTQGKNLDVLVSIPQRQQPQHSEGVRDGQISQAENHKRSSCRGSVPSESRAGARRDQPDKQDDLHGWHYRQGQSWLATHRASAGFIYLDDESGSDQVEAAVRGVLHAYGVDALSSPAVRGSWLRRLKLTVKAWAGSEQARELPQDLELAAHLRLLHQPMAEIDQKKSAAVCDLIKALEGQAKAVVMIGSILVVKVGDVLAVPELTMREIAHLARNPGLVADPLLLLSSPDQMMAPDSAGELPGQEVG
ncbi:hypothetical protein ACIBHX_31620 [Nonomuraea sp. NPDC050536]|uniref:hypothetical protein n=1 Tax=Nonomuraea sp. NPDC050536 TaxID=3364366 RepID=UPI0037C5F8D0